MAAGPPAHRGFVKIVVKDRSDETFRVFNAVLGCEQAQRASKLDDLCQSDPELRHRVERLLKQAGGETSLGWTPCEKTTDPVVPDKIGKYEIIEQIGQGGMGEVYRARHVELDQPVALKIMRAELTDRDDFLRRFKREQRFIAKIKNPHVVRVTDAGFESGLHYLVMEYLQGQDLQAYVRRRGPLPVGQAAVVIQHALQGLKAIADNDLVHRDIKPSNLFLGDDGIVRILDLGIAKLQGGDSSDSRESAVLTKSFQLVGTPDYIAPEQADRDQEIDIRADLYSLGCAWYFLLKGTPPYDNEHYSSAARKITAHLHEPFPEIGELNLPPSQKQALHRMVAKERELRPRDPDSLLNLISASPADTLRLHPTQWDDTDQHPAITTAHTRAKFRPSTIQRRFILVAAATIGVIALVGTGMQWIGKDDAETTLPSVRWPTDPEEVRDAFAKANPGFRFEDWEYRTDEYGDRMLQLYSPLVVDLEPLSNMVLEILMIDESSVVDVTPVANMNGLWLFQCTNARQLGSLEPLSHTNVTHVEIHGSKVMDLLPLKNLRLTYLDCNETAIKDLSPLSEMPLQTLIISETMVSRLDVLQGIPTLESIDCRKTRVGDLRPLMQIQNLQEIDADESLMRSATFLLDHPNSKKLRCNGKRVRDYFASAASPQHK